MKTSFSWEILQIIITCFDCQKLVFHAVIYRVSQKNAKCLASHGTIATSYNVYDLFEGRIQARLNENQLYRIKVFQKFCNLDYKTL